MRLSRPVINNCCVHITHRCQEKKYLLGCDIDRKYYQLLLYQVLKLLSKSDIVSFRKWYIKMLDYKYSRKLLQEEEKFWSNSFAVGGKKWFKEITLLTERDRKK